MKYLIFIGILAYLYDEKEINILPEHLQGDITLKTNSE